MTNPAPAPQRRSLGARAAKWTAIAALALLALVAVAVALSLVLLNTAWGRERLRRAGEQALGGLLAGTVSVGEVTGAPLSKLRVASLSLRGPDGQQQFVLGPVEVVWSPAALLHREVHVREVTLDHPVVRGRLRPDGSLDLASLLQTRSAPVTSSGPGAPSAWTVVVDHVVVRDGVVSLPVAAQDWSIEAVQVDGALRIVAGSVDLDVRRLNASYGAARQALLLAGSGRLVIGPGPARPPPQEAGWSLSLSGLDLRAGRSLVKISQVTLASDGALAAALEVEASAEELARFAPGAEVAGAVELGGTVTRAGDGQPLVFALRGHALGGALSGQLSFDPSAPAVRGALHGQDLVPPAGPAAQVSFDLHLDLAGFTAAAAKGKLELDASGVVGGQRVDALRVRAAIGAGLLSLDAAARLPGAHAGLRGRARLGEQAEPKREVSLGNRFVIDTARLQAEVRDLKLLRALRAGLSGSAALDLTASGPLSSLSAKGWLRADHPALGAVRAASLRAGFELRGLPGEPAGTAQVEVLGAAVGADLLGEVRAEVASRAPGSFAVKLVSSGPGATYGASLSAQVTREPAAVRIALGDLAVTARGLQFAGSGGEVLLGRGGALRVRGLALASTAGNLQASGALTLPGAGAPAHRQKGLSPASAVPDGRLEVKIAGADLALLRAAFAPGPGPLAGKLDLAATLLSHGGALSLDGSASGSGLVVREGLPALEASLRLSAARGLLRAEGRLRDPITGGAAELSFEAAVPQDLLDQAAWRRLVPLEAVHSGRLALHELDLTLLADQAQQLAGLEGALDGAVVLAPGTRELKFEVALRALGRPPLRGVDLDLQGRLGERALQLSGSATFEGVKALTFEGRAEAGLRDLLAGKARPDPLGVGLALDVEAKAFPLQTLQGLLGTKRELSGALDLSAALSGTARAPHLTGKLSLLQAQLAGVSFESFVASVKGDAGQVDVELSARQAGAARLDATASIDRKDAAASRLRVHSARFDLSFLAALSPGRGNQLAASGGLLDADVSLSPASGTTGRGVHGKIRVSDGKFYIPSSGPLDHLELEATLDGGHVVVEKLTGRSGSGKLTASLDANLVGLLPRDFTLHLGLEDLPVLAGVRVVKVTTQATVTGGARADGVLAVVATLDGARIRVPTEQRKGSGLQSVHGSKDVVFVDGRAPPPGAAPVAAAPVEGAPVVAAPHAADPLAEKVPAEPVAQEAAGGGLRVRLELVTPGAVEVHGPELDLFLRQHLIVTLRDGQTLISGGVETERGFVVLFGARWEVSTAALSFQPRSGFDPRLDLQLSREFRTTTVYVSVNGTVSKPKLTLRADPGSYEQSQILSWVMGGSPDDPAGPSPALGTQAVGVASNFLLGPLQDQLRALLPIDVLAVKLGEGSDTQTTRVQVGKWISEALFLGYRGRINSPDATKNQSEANIEWRFARRWFLEAFYGDHGAGGADAIWSMKY